jgi:hypothetical protein
MIQQDCALLLTTKRAECLLSRTPITIAEQEYLLTFAEYLVEQH